MSKSDYSPIVKMIDADLDHWEGKQKIVDPAYRAERHKIIDAYIGKKLDIDELREQLNIIDLRYRK